MIADEADGSDRSSPAPDEPAQTEASDETAAAPPSVSTREVEPTQRRWGPAMRWVRKIGTGLGLLAATAMLLASVHEHYAIQHWLFWKYLKCWGYSALWGASGLTAGLAAIRRLFPEIPRAEQWVHASAVGAYLHFLGTFLIGLAGAIGPASMVLLPAVLLAGGFDELRRGARYALAWRRNGRLTPSREGDVDGHRRIGWLGYAVVAFGFASVCLLYLSILSPKNAAFDTRMYHLGLAEGWAATGRIEASAEGWFVETLPQLTAVVFTWAQAVPGLDYFEHIELAAHLEFVMFLWTLFGVGVLARRLAPRAKARLSWVAMFLFPALFVYDAGLHSGSDHVAAFFAPPIALALYRSFALEPRPVALLAFMMGCAFLVKYQAMAVIVGPVIVVSVLVVRAIVLQVRRREAPPWATSSAIAIVVGLVATAPHWLKNLAWHGDPLYPALHKRLELRPWGPGAEVAMANTWQKLKGPEGTLLEKLTETAKNFSDYAFETFTYERFHGTRPIFGALFALSILWLPFVRGARRTWLLVGLANVGVFTWYYLSHVERYLQVLVPWMAAAVAAALVLAWQEGLFARLGVGLLVGFQVVWGGDAPFFPTHGMHRKAALSLSVDLLGSSLQAKSFTSRNDVFGAHQKIGDQLPPGAVVLLHEFNPRVGLRTEVVSDMPNNQGAISYGFLDSPGDVYDLYRELGITHILWRGTTRSLDSRAGDARFFQFVESYVPERSRQSGWIIGTMPSERPAEPRARKVVSLGCTGSLAPGVVEFEALRARRVTKAQVVAPLPDEPEALAALLDEAEFVLAAGRCTNKLPPAKRGDFAGPVKRRGGEQIWIRRPE